MDAKRAFGRLSGRSAGARVVVKNYGRDSLVVWGNLLLAPLFTRLGLRVGLQSEERIAARIETDTTAMRKKGYLVSSVETFSLPGLVGTDTAAQWYRVTYELTTTESPEARGREDA